MLFSGPLGCSCYRPAWWQESFGNEFLHVVVGPRDGLDTVGAPVVVSLGKFGYVDRAVLVIVAQDYLLAQGRRVVLGGVVGKRVVIALRVGAVHRHGGVDLDRDHVVGQLSFLRAGSYGIPWCSAILR